LATNSMGNRLPSGWSLAQASEVSPGLGLRPVVNDVLEDGDELPREYRLDEISVLDRAAIARQGTDVP
jgi:hypothetical protein